MDDERSLIGRQTRIELRALTEGWDVPQEVRRAILARIVDKLRDPTTTIRDLDRINRMLVSNARLRLDIERLIAELDGETQAGTSVNIQINNPVAHARETLAGNPVIGNAEIARIAKGTG